MAAASLQGTTSLAVYGAWKPVLMSRLPAGALQIPGLWVVCWLPWTQVCLDGYLRQGQPSVTRVACQMLLPITCRCASLCSSYSPVFLVSTLVTIPPHFLFFLFQSRELEGERGAVASVRPTEGALHQFAAGRDFNFRWPHGWASLAFPMEKTQPAP